MLDKDKGDLPPCQRTATRSLCQTVLVPCIGAAQPENKTPGPVSDHPTGSPYCHRVTISSKSKSMPTALAKQQQNQEQDLTFHFPRSLLPVCPYIGFSKGNTCGHAPPVPLEIKATTDWFIATLWVVPCQNRTDFIKWNQNIPLKWSLIASKNVPELLLHSS